MKKNSAILIITLFFDMINKLSFEFYRSSNQER